MFRGTNSLRGKTVLMFTHDFEPILDIAYNLKRNFTPTPTVTFIQNKENRLTEINIEKTDILSCQKIVLENIKNLSENINKLIYLRRYKEIEDDKSNTYALLSSLFIKDKFQLNRIMKKVSNDIWRSSKWCRGNKRIYTRLDYYKEYEKVISDECLIKLYKWL